MTAKQPNKGKSINEKQCLDCHAPLNPPINITQSRFDARKYVCSACWSKRVAIKYPEKYNRIKERNFKIKLKIIEIYGGKCNCCNETHIEFLTINHINRNGAEERRETDQGAGIEFFKWLLKRNCPTDNYELNCFNCNCSDGAHKHCPHKENINMKDEIKILDEKIKSIQANNAKNRKPKRKITRKNEGNKEIKICTDCDDPLTPENSSKEKYGKYLCNDCATKRNKVRYANNKELSRLRHRKDIIELRIKVMDAYGNKCECCGEDHFAFLTIDHINGNGGEERKNKKYSRGDGFYRYLVKNNFPKDNYRCLCYNCNLSHGFFGYCPHQKSRETYLQEQKELQNTTFITETNNKEIITATFYEPAEEDKQKQELSVTILSEKQQEEIKKTGT